MEKLIIAILMAILSMPQSFAQSVPFIPQATMEAAKEAGAEIITQAPTSEVVRVGIGTSNFASYQYNDLTVFGSKEILSFSLSPMSKMILSFALVKATYKSLNFS
jgi:hypothetical protein